MALTIIMYFVEYKNAANSPPYQPAIFYITDDFAKNKSLNNN